MLKRGMEVLTILLILIVLVSGVGFAQETEVNESDDFNEENNDENETADEREEKVKVCHIPSGDREKANTLEISRDSLEDHLAHGDYEGECEDEVDDVDEELGDAGSKPGDLLYGVDSFFEGLFGDCLNDRKERIAEIRELVQEKKFDEAKEALRGYEECADELEKEVTPEEEEAARRSAKVIRQAIREIEGEIPSNERKKFKDVIDTENKIEAAAEIASKIKDLCQQLANLDPSEYERVCRVKGDAPKWQRDLDDRLTEEQKVEVKEFVGIMRECFENPKECRCNDIKIKPFADKCSIIAPLAAQCEIENNEEACSEMEEIEREGDPFELLPDYLREAVESLEDDYDEDRVGNFMPPECKEAGVTTPKDCMKIMFKTHAPQECQEALERGEINFENERDARMKCEEIMFKANAPPECIEAGLKDHRECGKLTFRNNAPPECIEAGLTGENRNDHRKCEEIMRSQMGEGGERRGSGGQGRGPAFGARCKEIKDSEERLKCFDSVLEGFGDYNGEFEGRAEGFRDYEQRGSEGNWPSQCKEAGATTPDSCRKVMEEFGKMQQEGRDRPEFREGEGSQDGQFRPPQCAPGQRWNCFEGQCKCEGEPSGEFKEGEFRPPEEFQQPTFPTGEGEQVAGTTASGETTSGTTTTTTEGSGTVTTGGVIMVDNRFTDYYYYG